MQWGSCRLETCIYLNGVQLWGAKCHHIPTLMHGTVMAPIRNKVYAAQALCTPSPRSPNPALMHCGGVVAHRAQDIP